MSNTITRGQIGQALESAYIEKNELEDVVENILSLLGVAWEQGLHFAVGGHPPHAVAVLYEANPYKQ